MRTVALLLFAALPCLAQNKQLDTTGDMLRMLAQKKAQGERIGLVTATPIHEPFFGYDGSLGPEYWADLDERWSLCGEGVFQSPININVEDAVISEGPALTFNYNASPLGIVNNGHTIKFNYGGGSAIWVGEHRYDLVQFHFHTPSEHRVENGAVFDLEMHLVHADSDGHLAVVGIMIAPSRDLDAASFPFSGPDGFAQILPGSAGVEHVFFFDTIDVASMIPEDHSTYRYSGSLTTPPCSEGVSWFVMRQPLRVNAEEVRVFRSALNQVQFSGRDGNSSRPDQPLHQREVTLVQ